jgi:hypothetical protein
VDELIWELVVEDGLVVEDEVVVVDEELSKEYAATPATTMMRITITTAAAPDIARESDVFMVFPFFLLLYEKCNLGREITVGENGSETV